MVPPEWWHVSPKFSLLGPWKCQNLFPRVHHTFMSCWHHLPHLLPDVNHLLPCLSVEEGERVLGVLGFAMISFVFPMLWDILLLISSYKMLRLRYALYLSFWFPTLIFHLEFAFKINRQGLHVSSFDILKSRYATCCSFRYWFLIFQPPFDFNLQYFGLPCDFSLFYGFET